MIASVTISDARVHYTWSSAHPPIAEIEPGQTVTVATRDRFDGQLSSSVAGEDLDDRLHDVLDLARLAPLTGPVAVAGAEVGDALRVRLTDLDIHGTGVSVVWPAWAERDFIDKPRRRPFPLARIRRFALDGLAPGDHVELLPGIRAAIAPTLAIIGTAPAVGELNADSARDFGGALDIKDVVPGTAVYLPVACPGGLLSLGGGRAMQPDGAVTAASVECRTRARISVDLIKDMPVPHPRVETPTTLMTTASARTLDAAAKEALRRMLDVLITERGLSPQDAYMLCSLAGDLRINRVTGTAEVGARMTLPRRYLAGTLHAV